jgi:hypothetical protein
MFQPDIRRNRANGSEERRFRCRLQKGQGNRSGGVLRAEWRSPEFLTGPNSRGRKHL